MVREDIDALRAGMRRRGALDALSPTIDRAVTLDKNRRETIQAVEERKAARNAVSQQVGQRKRASESADDLQQRSRELGDEIARLDRELAETESELSAILIELPNITLDQVPAGGEESNQVVRTWGVPREGARVGAAESRRCVFALLSPRSRSRGQGHSWLVAGARVRQGRAGSLRHTGNFGRAAGAPHRSRRKDPAAARAPVSRGATGVGRHR